MKAASTLAAPDSSPIGLGRGDSFTDDDEAGEQCGASTDPGDDVTAFPPQLQHRGPGCQRRRPTGGQCVVAGGQPRRLSGGVDASDLHGQGGDSGRAQNQNGHQGRDGQSGLDRAETTGYTRVFSARPMMLVSAPTIESPVTTL